MTAKRAQKVQFLNSLMNIKSNTYLVRSLGRHAKIEGKATFWRCVWVCVCVCLFNHESFNIYCYYRKYLQNGNRCHPTYNGQIENRDFSSFWKEFAVHGQLSTTGQHIRQRAVSIIKTKEPSLKILHVCSFQVNLSLECMRIKNFFHFDLLAPEKLKFSSFRYFRYLSPSVPSPQNNYIIFHWKLCSHSHKK